MKQTKVFLFAVVVSLSAFCAVIYSSCQKDATCAGFCMNGGTCVNGECRCVSGFTGLQCQFSKIVYYNGTFTTLTLLFSTKVIDTIPPFQTKELYGIPGDTARVLAYTYGPNGNDGVVMGDSVKWDSVKTAFSPKGIQPVYFDCSSKYFFLRMMKTTTGAVNVTSVNVNQSYPSALGDTVRSASLDVNVDSVHYTKVGYFVALPHTDVTVLGTTFYPYFSYSKNQVYTLMLP